MTFFHFSLSLFYIQKRTSKITVSHDSCIIVSCSLDGTIMIDYYTIKKVHDSI